MPNTFTSHEYSEYVRRGDKPWPAAGHQARYQAQAEYPPLVNATFTIGPWVPFSFDWRLREEPTPGGTIWSPESGSPTPQWTSSMTAFSNSNPSMPAALGGAVPKGAEVQEIIDKSSTELYNVVVANKALQGIFDANIEVPGEISSEMMALDPTILGMLEGTAGGTFTDEYWAQLDEADMFSSDAVDLVEGYQVTGGAKEYLDKSPLTASGKRSLQIYLSAFEQLGIPKDILENVIGGEETVDTASKLISGRVKEHMHNTTQAGGTVQDAVRFAAQEWEDMVNSFLGAGGQGHIGREEWMRTTDPFKDEMMSVAESTLGSEAVHNTFEYWTSPQGPIGRYTGGKGSPTKPTKGTKMIGELRQMMKRAIQTAILGEQGQAASMTVPAQGTWYYQIPISQGFAAIFFISPTWSGQIQRTPSGEHIIPDDLHFSVEGHTVKASFEKELAGSMDAILFQAGVAAGAWTSEYLNEFINRRNVHLGSFHLLYALQGQDFSHISTNMIHNISLNSMFPAIAVLGAGIPGSRITVGSLTELIRKELSNFANHSTVIQGISTAIENAVFRTNQLTQQWKKQFIQAMGGNISSPQFDYEAGGAYGVWSQESEALQAFLGRGIAMSPIFAFDQVPPGDASAALSAAMGLGGPGAVKNAFAGMQGAAPAGGSWSKLATTAPDGSTVAEGVRWTPEYLQETPNFLEAGLYR